ncbi:hypothetical protein DL240_12300 [Lujinxingia litoralis]|uniref:Uncharacterized protein n=1 Tax=Lujinxingia litoralis TaxID=2211119 RepID=A0A328C3R8_9DELT|nr:hypothetical protein [Lujinxingia litoralis]RAL21632.1 hypothetical protein DL240_12300 [Lujinxingia litoralis]
MSYKPWRAAGALLLLLLMLSLTSCGIAAFSFTQESDVIEIEGQGSSLLGLGSLFPTTIPLTVNLAQELEAQDATGASAVYLTGVRFELEDDSQAPDFDFIDAVTINIASAQSGSELPEVDLAWRDPAPEGAGSFELEVAEGIDLKPYIEEGMRLNSAASGSAPDDDARFRVFAEFRVEVF